MNSPGWWSRYLCGCERRHFVSVKDEIARPRFSSGKTKERTELKTTSFAKQVGVQESKTELLKDSKAH